MLLASPVSVGQACFFKLVFLFCHLAAVPVEGKLLAASNYPLGSPAMPAKKAEAGTFAEDQYDSQVLPRDITACFLKYVCPSFPLLALTTPAHPLQRILTKLYYNQKHELY